MVHVVVSCSLDFCSPVVMPSFSIFSSVQLEQGTVTSLLEENGTIKGVQYKTKDGKELQAYAPLTIVCDGCFSNLRRSLCNPQVWFPLNLTH
jgi:2-polyprenyl-6-methoxyphenol hydroxylase-like FAD-dependent oxidoreductase